MVGAGSNHPAGPLSSVKIIISLYYYKMNHNPGVPSRPMRDSFIMSKDHATPVLYVTFANCSYFPEEKPGTFRKSGSPLQ
ncbi:MAG: hypothetical protein J7M18_05355 [Candidatus Eremiobacteraeota bacterium]|nr:hypothetical protein [Candidatus Eremiobacteraeota bacterium]